MTDFFAAYQTEATAYDSHDDSAGLGSPADDHMGLETDIPAYAGLEGDDLFDFDGPWSDSDATPTMTGGEGQDIYALNLLEVSGARLLEITDFDPQEDVILVYNMLAEDEVYPTYPQFNSLEAVPDPDGAFVDLVFTTPDGATSLRLHGLTEYDPNQVVFSRDIAYVEGNSHSVESDSENPREISAPTDWDDIGTAGDDTLTVSDGRYIDTGSGDDLVDASAADTAIIDLGDGNDVLTGAQGDISIAGGTGDDTLGFGTGVHVDPGSGADSLVMSIEASGSAPAVIEFNDPADTLSIEVAADLPQGVHLELREDEFVALNIERFGSLYLDVYLTDTPNPDLTALTPVAILHIGGYNDYDADHPLGPDYTTTIDETIALTFNVPQLSGYAI